MNVSRGKRISDGEWYTGNLITECNGDIKTVRAFIHLRLSPVGFTKDSLTSTLCLHEVDLATVGHHIGKGEYFEGDIIEITYDTAYSEKEKSLHYIKYQADEGYPAFDLVPWIDCEMNALSWLFSNSDPSVLSYKVIGNIHDNKELIESGGAIEYTQ